MWIARKWLRPDTANDMKTASNANLGMAIGVLTGIATKKNYMKLILFK